MKEIIQKLVLVIFSFLFAVLLFEGLAWFAPRSLLPRPLLALGERMEISRRSEDFFVPDSDLLFKIPPNTNFLVKHPDYSVRVKTNLNLGDIGFRGGSFGGPAWGVAVGDSFTFGVGVEQEETWIGRLAKSLGREVINFGIPAQGPVQYTLVLKKYALPMHPKVAFYGFYFNDLDSAQRFRRMKRQFIPVSRYLRQYSYVYNLVGQRGPAVDEQPFLFKAGNVELSLDLKALRRTLERQNRSFEERWSLTIREVDDAIKIAKDARVAFVLLYLPSRWEIYWDQIKQQTKLPDSLDIDRLRRTVVDYCSKQQILCVDLTTALKQAARHGGPLYFPNDGHLNKEGNRVVADTVLKLLLENGIVQ